MCELPPELHDRDREALVDRLITKSDELVFALLGRMLIEQVLERGKPDGA